MKRMAERIARGWCRLMHSRVMRPVDGRYRCAVCLRVFAVEWDVVNEGRPLRKAGKGKAMSMAKSSCERAA